MAEKTEKATPKKLRDARKKGQVAKSQDFPSAFTFIVSIAATLIGATTLYEKMASFMATSFKRIGPGLDLTNQAGGLLSECLSVILDCSLPIIIITSLVGVLISFLVVGPVFSGEAVKFDLKRLNPVQNIKNLFKFKTLFELLKSVFKITGAVIIIYWTVKESLPNIVATVTLSLWGSVLVLSHFLTQVIIRVGIFFLIVAIVDLLYQKKNFGKEMKMEKFEVKQEYKDTEGDPHIKSKRKQTAQELAYQEGPQAVRRSRAVIVNPIHIAVAIDYDEENEPAPRITTMGRDYMAERIVREAVDYHIPVMRNPDLAQTLFTNGTIGFILST